MIRSLLPESPRAAKWLSSEEQSWIEQQLAMDLTSGRRQKENGILRALMNPFVLAFMLVNMIVLGSYYAFNLSAPQILGEATHLDISAVGYLVAAGGLIAAAAMLFAGWHSDYTGERFVHLAIPLLTSAVAYGNSALHQVGGLAFDRDLTESERTAYLDKLEAIAALSRRMVGASGQLLHTPFALGADTFHLSQADASALFERERGLYGSCAITERVPTANDPASSFWFSVP